ncbi:hypothetical protein BN1708_011575 [Verticillium longisporum]|uniref:Thioesterase domain-containing protein n=1 Tax=Verticillium longisporum TaxID=100787 RepID=A0A0G4L1B1_VERLO|nr:thioesterase lcsE like protein [Verticillium longisporum]CRK15833.1 hypothetical protein BN1708_011575 [Verticillium longisporum]
MLGHNPATIQRCFGGAEAQQLPLVLIHDGGGTCFDYRLLERQGRAVYAIHNPRFRSGRPWNGGIREMAGVYVELVRSLMPHGGAIILGGWSLGGMVALEMAKVLEGDVGVGVAGVVTVDSVAPSEQGGPTRSAADAWLPNQIRLPNLSTSCPAEIRVGVFRSLKQAWTLVSTWTPPTWDAGDPSVWVQGGVEAGVGEHMVPCTPDFLAASPRLPGPSLAADDGDGASGRKFTLDLTTTERTRGKRQTGRRPMVVLLRAMGRVPSPPGVTSRVDLQRHERLLGWQRHGCRLVDVVRDVPGDHFSLFSSEHVGGLSAELQGSCQAISQCY